MFFLLCTITVIIITDSVIIIIIIRLLKFQVTCGDCATDPHNPQLAAMGQGSQKGQDQVVFDGGWLSSKVYELP